MRLFPSAMPERGASSGSVFPVQQADGIQHDEQGARVVRQSIRHRPHSAGSGKNNGNDDCSSGFLVALDCPGCGLIRRDVVFPHELQRTRVPCFPPTIADTPRPGMVVNCSRGCGALPQTLACNAATSSATTNSYCAMAKPI